MSRITQEIAAARRALATLADAAPLLPPQAIAQAAELLTTFASSARTLARSADTRVGAAFKSLLPRWLALFHNQSAALRSALRSRKMGSPPARSAGEPEELWLRRVLLETLDRHGKKETECLIKEASKAAAQSQKSAKSKPDPEKEIFDFLRQIGLLTRSEARETILSAKPGFLRKVAAFRRIPFDGVPDTAFINRLHESAARFARNTAL